MAGKVAIVLFNLGGPDGQEAVQPFLRNLFSDPAILRVPGFVRWPLAWLIAKRRAPIAKEIYQKIGGGSPILKQTQRQADALAAKLQADGMTAACFIAMRYWHPMSDETAQKVKAYNPDRIVLLPLYPQFSTTTTESSLADWDRAAEKIGLNKPTDRIISYPVDEGFITAQADLIAAKVQDMDDKPYRLLFSAHGLPKKVVESGDPYCDQVAETANALVYELTRRGILLPDWQICYQSRVGPLEWVGPNTEDEIKRAASDNLNLIVVPLAFVSEHSETLVELDLEYGDLARDLGIGTYLRASTVQDHPAFVQGLANLVKDVLDG
ncbi:MAG: ferrochelatase [Alphaproteobacteria bacterium]